jgi:acyl carrier protein
MLSQDSLRQILAAQLGPDYPAEGFRTDTPLLGAIPELDSMAVVGILAAIEDATGIAISDDEVNAEVFSTFGTLAEFVNSQCQPS